jgi:anti-sigma B factor antagonist
MNITSEGSTLQVTGLAELNAANSSAFRDQVRAAIQPQHANVLLDFSQTRFVDSSGLGALISIHKSLCGRGGVVRIHNPTPPVQQILELTRMHRIFEVTRS